VIPAHIHVGVPSAPHVAFLLHGALGAGHNFRSFARRLAAEKPEYRFVLVDLRNHGASQDAPPPHTIEACVNDLLELAAALGVTPRAVIGHSFGGKVALTYGRRLAQNRAVTPELAQSLTQVWALDSDPGTQRPDPNHEVLRVLRALRTARGPFAARTDAIGALLAQELSSGLANWLATNLERRDAGYEWRLSVDAIEELMEDYFGEDLWPYLEAARGTPHHHLVVADQSDRWTGTMRERAASLPTEASVTVHELADSGHWVHVDNPDGLLRIFAAHLA
jgi:pimeloyl-ACP methyl ester carboxylesterase